MQEFILIDDDQIVLTFCKLLLKKAYGEIEVKTFEMPEQGLDYLTSGFSSGINTQAVILLDINMPDMDGWQFLERFEKLDDHLKQHVQIYILSSSVDERDKERAVQNKYVVDYLLKPLKKDVIAQLF